MCDRQNRKTTRVEYTVFFIDTHAHIQESAFDTDRSETLDRAREAGVKRIVCVGYTVDSSRRAVELAHNHPDVFAVVGIQPNYVHEARPADWETILELTADSKVVGIGETGLDLYWKSASLDLQIDYFFQHIRLAREKRMPFIVHLRDADDAMVQTLKTAAKEGPLHGLMHSFSGTAETARECIELGLYMSFSGMITSKGNKALRAIAAEVPLDRLLIETDCPYLAPSPNRGKRNEPAFVQFTAKCLAEIRGVSVEELAEITTQNAQTVFSFPTP